MALSYVRTLELTVSKIKVLFNDDIDTSVGVNNVVIISSIDSVDNPEIRSVSVEDEVVTVTFSQLFPNVQYDISFISTSAQSFKTVNGEIIAEDGNRNSFFIVSPGEAQNDIRDEMFNDISTLYETGEPTLVRDLVSSAAETFQKASDTIGTVKSANYLSVLVTDELKTRDDGPIDKLDHGGAFEILRVSSNPTGTTRALETEFNSTRGQQFITRSGIIVNSVISSLTLDPISAQAVDVVGEKVTDDVLESNHFEGLLVKVSKPSVIQVISVSLLRAGTYTEYNIESFGYTLKNNRYDTLTASTNVNLNDNELELSSSSITGAVGGFLLPKAGDEIYISYVYKKLGRDIDKNNVTLSRIVNVVRESTPAVINKFSLDFAPVVTSTDQAATSNGVTFLNTQAVDGNSAFTTTHPAFISEIPYSTTKFPGRPGEYSVNYAVGEVYVFGEDIENTGTGDSPPVASYMYREIFSSGLDFTYNSDRSEIAINSTRSLSGIEAKLSVLYEDTFAAGTDYRVASHVEVLNERVNNKLIGPFRLETTNSPITDVFRILNETTGELYTLDRFNDTSVSFSGRAPPRQENIIRERANFTRVPQEVLLVSDELTNSISLSVFKIDLANNGIIDSQGRYIGANFDTSVLLSDTDKFVREFFYEDKLFQSVSANLNRLLQVGDYCIDYSNGIIYVAVTSSQSTDIGDVLYQHKKITPTNDHILGVDNIYRSQNSLLANVQSYTVGTITDTTVDTISLEQIGERFLNNNVTRTLLIGTHQSGEDGATTNGNNSFVSFSGIFTSADIGRSLTVGSASQAPIQEVTIISVINSHEVLVSPVFTYTKAGRVWAVLDLSTGAPKTIALNNNIVSVSDIYTVTQLGTLPAASLDGYFNVNTDSISGNIITLGAANPLQVGDAVVVNYNPGNIFVDYLYLKDDLILSYEYGNNSLDWSISSSLSTDGQYYVTYKYGALRDALLLNFGSLTQIAPLANFSPNLNREIYRSILGGTLQSFVEGPTVTSIERLTESFTDVTPNISESAFSDWILGRDNLHLRSPAYSVSQTFDLGRFGNGALINSSVIEVPALAHLRLNEGTLETWVRPQWKGLSNDSDIVFNSLTIDGYSDLSSVFIGFSGSNPTEFPFTLNIEDTVIPVLGEPSNIESDTGYFIWFDEFADIWNVRWRESTSNTVDFKGSIETGGEFYNVLKPVGSDGYEITEITDVITSTTTGIDFTAFIDGYDIILFDDGYGNITVSNQYAMDGISFAAGDSHYIFDMAGSQDANRMSIFKDGTGYLNFQVFDNKSEYGLDAGFYNLSKDIRDWDANSLHHVAASWKFNSSSETDEMHMFVDGQEVPNLFKYGGNPKANSTFDFGDVAEETVISSSSLPIVGGFDGSTETGSLVFISASHDFTAIGVTIGSLLYILDDTPDGIGAPNLGASYTVTGVGTTSLTLDRAPTLTLGSLGFSINQSSVTVTTPVNIQDFIVIEIDTNGNETELNGVDSTEPDYSVSRGGGNSHIISINNGVSLYGSVIIRQLGLILRRCKQKIYSYGGTDELRLYSPPPVSLGDVRITSIVLDTTLISTERFTTVATIIGSELVTLLESNFDSAGDGYIDICQPSNSTAGKKLAITLSGNKIDFNIPGNTVVVYGIAYSGATTEVIPFTETGTIITSEFWKVLYSISVSIVPIDISEAAGAIDIKEYKPITVEENYGTYAEVVEYSNGIFRVEIYGTGGIEFILDSCIYEIDYPTYLKINIDKLPDTFFVGSDYSGANKFDGVIDEFVTFDTMLGDIRPGEPSSTNAESVTKDYNITLPMVSNNNTLLLMHLNDNVMDSSVFRDKYDGGFETAPSVNTNFDLAIRFDENNPYVSSNAWAIFNADEGTVEFWINPLDDTRGDPNYHYYIDMLSVIDEEATSISNVNVIAAQRVREVESVRLVTDIKNSGTNYYTGGSLSSSDRKTITLGIPLPSSIVSVKISYIPLNNQGDRVSIFKDPSGHINFFVKASGVEHLITVPVSWNRNTWHRVMAMWKMNSIDNQDRLRLFVDGSEQGTIKYGTGLIYGTGVIYGQAEIRTGINRFLVDDINLTDTFAKIYFGTDVFGVNGARALMDNVRFSSIQRLLSITVSNGETIDLNYIENKLFAEPVIEDSSTTSLYNFDITETDIEFLATIVNSGRGIFRFEVEVIDSFDKVVGNTDLEELLVELIETIKPAHSESSVVFTS